LGKLGLLYKIIINQIHREEVYYLEKQVEKFNVSNAKEDEENCLKSFREIISF